MTSISPYVGPVVLVAGVDFDMLPIREVTSMLTHVQASHESGQIRLRIISDSGETSNYIDELPEDICIGIAVSETDVELLETLALERVRARPSHHISDFKIVRLSSDNAAIGVVANAVQEGLLRLLGAVATRNAESMLALASVRREHEILQEAFVSLEEVVLSSNFYEKPAYTQSPGRESLSPGRSWSPGDPILQRFPVSSRAVSAVDLCFIVTDEECQGNFCVVLRTLEDGEEAGRWQIPFDHVTSGWNQFQLDQALIGDPRTIEIEVSFDVTSGEAPELVLSAPSVVEDAVYGTGSGKKGDCPLAFRVWRSVMGLRTQPTVGAFRTHGHDHTPPVQRLSHALLASAQPIGGGDADTSQALVQFIAEHGELQVHPKHGSPVAAFLKRAVPPFARRITASVITRHPDADILDYAMIAVQGRQSLDDILERAARGAPAFDGFSGWVMVPPMESYVFSLSLENPSRTSLDLVLLTRAHDGTGNIQNPWGRFWARATGRRGHTKFAWARFAEIQVEISRQ